MNMFKKVAAKTVEEYIAAAPPHQKDAIIFLHKFIQKEAPGLKPHFANNMLGYGSFEYKNYKKEVLLWPVVALAYQKHYISVYVCCVVDGEYVAEKHKNELGTVKVGKSCINIKDIKDVNLETLKTVIKVASKNPGFDLKS